MGTEPVAQREILSAIRCAGGRASIAELDFQLRLHGVLRAPGTTLEGQLRKLQTMGYLRGPSTKALAYELTTAGWDAVTALDTRDLWEHVQQQQLARR